MKRSIAVALKLIPAFGIILNNTQLSATELKGRLTDAAATRLRLDRELVQKCAELAGLQETSNLDYQFHEEDNTIDLIDLYGRVHNVRVDEIAANATPNLHKFD